MKVIFDIIFKRKTKHIKKVSLKKNPEFDMPAKVVTNTIHNFVCGKDQTEHLNGNNVLHCMQLE